MPRQLGADDAERRVVRRSRRLENSGVRDRVLVRCVMTLMRAHPGPWCACAFSVDSVDWSTPVADMPSLFGMRLVESRKRPSPPSVYGRTVYPSGCEALQVLIP